MSNVLNPKSRKISRQIFDSCPDCHGGGSLVPPSNVGTATPRAPQTAAPASIPTSLRSQTTLDGYAAATPPPGTSAAQHGTVAIRSHFQSIRGEDSPPAGLVGQLASFRQPTYPLEAPRARVEGTVMLRVLVDPSGTVESIRLVSGPPLLVTASINAVWRWRYAQATLNARAVECVEDVTVTFRLGNCAASPR